MRFGEFLTDLAEALALAVVHAEPGFDGVASTLVEGVQQVVQEVTVNH